MFGATPPRRERIAAAAAPADDVLGVLAAAVLAVLADGLTDSSRLTLAKKIDGVETAWTLGAMLDLLS